MWSERNRWRRGRWLVKDDESDEVLDSDQVVRRWDGMYVRRDQDEPIDPQWFITSENDPAPLPFVRPDEPAPRACRTSLPYGPNNQPLDRFPGYNLYVGASIGSMEIGCSFIVFPNGVPLPARS